MGLFAESASAKVGMKWRTCAVGLLPGRCLFQNDGGWFAESLNFALPASLARVVNYSREELGNILAMSSNWANFQSTKLVH